MTRIVAGIVLVAWGYTLLPSVVGIILVLVGLVPISALFGGLFQGAAVRAAGKK